MCQQPIVILGGRNFIAPYLIARLDEAGLQADVISRDSVSLPKGFRSVSLELGQTNDWHAPEGAIVISLLPLGVLACNLTRFAKVQSIIAVGSTSRFSRSSNDVFERILAENLELAENILRPWCVKNNTVFTVLRPTLVYDGMNDQSIARMMNFIRRAGVFPIASPGKGLRQPIHADDVAKAIMNALGNVNVYNLSLNIAGGEVITYRHMVERVFIAMNRKPRVIALPSSWCQNSFRLMAKLSPSHVHAFSPEVFRRMNDDFIYDADEGLLLLDYAPRGFMPEAAAS
jgi:nucleoside-diphosphate-sugar epimerase